MDAISSQRCIVKDVATVWTVAILGLDYRTHSGSLEGEALKKKTHVYSLER